MTLRSLSSHSGARFDSGVRDLRGQRLRLGDSDERAHVNELLVDDSGTVRYADIQFGGKHRVVPIGYVRSLPSRKHLTLRGLSTKQLRDAPTYDPSNGTIDSKLETELERHYDDLGDTDSRYAGPDYRGHGWRSSRDEQVARLDRLDDYKVADHSPDPRGWPVVDREGGQFGRVDHLVGDTKAMKVSCLVIDLDDSLVKEDRMALIPVGYAELDTNDNRVFLRAIDKSVLMGLPVYRKDSDYMDVLKRTRASLRSKRSDQSRYEEPRYQDDALSDDENELRVQRIEEELLVGKNRHEGAVVVEKTVEEARATGQETLREDHVEVERVAARPGASAKTTIGEDEIRIPVVKEELVVAKKPVVQEEIVVRRRTGRRTEKVQKKVAKERVHVKREGAAKQESI